MKVLLINGSPRKEGNTFIGLNEMIKVFNEEGVETELINVGGLDIRGCMACRACHTTGKCVIDDIVNEVSLKLDGADGIVVGSPVYYASANGTLVSFLQRLFYSYGNDLTMKVGASVACARRSGTTATFDELNKFFAISGMTIAGSQYWNNVHGHDEGEAADDAEGLQTMRTLARNMVFLMKSIALGKEKFGLPKKESKKEVTSFFR